MCLRLRDFAKSAAAESVDACVHFIILAALLAAQFIAVLSFAGLYPGCAALCSAVELVSILVQCSYALQHNSLQVELLVACSKCEIQPAG